MSHEPLPKLAKGVAAFKVRPLPADYTLGEYDVICGRGSTCFNHIGNRRFRKLVASYLDKYSNTTFKVGKNAIICEIVQYVRNLSPNGGFVKKNRQTGQFVEVGDFQAREKTSQALRDALHHKYKSSNAVKRRRRLMKKCGSDSDLLKLTPSNVPYASEFGLNDDHETDLSVSSCSSSCTTHDPGVRGRIPQIQTMKPTISLVSIGSTNTPSSEFNNVQGSQSNWTDKDVCKDSSVATYIGQSHIAQALLEYKRGVQNTSNNGFESSEAFAGRFSKDEMRRYMSRCDNLQQQQDDARFHPPLFDSSRQNVPLSWGVNYHDGNGSNKAGLLLEGTADSFGQTSKRANYTNLTNHRDGSTIVPSFYGSNSRLLDSIPETGSSVGSGLAETGLEYSSLSQYNVNDRRSSLSYSSLLQRNQEESTRRSSLAFSSLFQATFNASLYGSTIFDGELDVSNNSQSLRIDAETKPSNGYSINGADLRHRFLAEQTANRSSFLNTDIITNTDAERRLGHTIRRCSIGLSNITNQQLEAMSSDEILFAYRREYGCD